MLTAVSALEVLALSLHRGDTASACTLVIARDPSIDQHQTPAPLFLPVQGSWERIRLHPSKPTHTLLFWSSGLWLTQLPRLEARKT